MPPWHMHDAATRLPVPPNGTAWHQSGPRGARAFFNASTTAALCLQLPPHDDVDDDDDDDDAAAEAAVVAVAGC